ncbi:MULTISPECIES: glycosyl hydrolase family 28-related protein [unclassified Bacillus (in: firmicutes)]|uniref:glycosyl hydrolase family 28-related protein n=1 Tax=unclassified Bacillus (in: firmicutes) TaxID=185979 RepID=UPI0027E18B91|nr:MULTISPECIES: glycosyl hydrolase family 28-related protein [unclassified Bacillus (in: firmicutes)]
MLALIICNVLLILLIFGFLLNDLLENENKNGLLQNSLINVIDLGADPNGDTDSTRAFQDAINLAGKSKGIVFIPKGKYILSQIKIPSYVELLGTGNDTVLRMKENNNKALIVLKSKVTQMVHLRDFMIDGNRKNQTSTEARGIEFINTSDSVKMRESSKVGEHDARHLIENVYISETKGDGLYIEGRGESRIKNVQTMRTDGVGIYSNAFDNWFTDCSTGASGLDGIYIGNLSANSRFVNCKSWFSGRINPERGNGYFINANRITITGSEAQDNSKYGFVFAANDIIGSGLMAEANGWHANKIRPDGTGFVLYGSKNCNIQGVAADRFKNIKSHQTYALQFLEDPKGNFVQISSEGMRLGALPTLNIKNNKVMIIETRSDGSVNNFQNFN